MIEHGHAILTGDTLHFNLSQILPVHPGAYTIELRSSLQSLFPEPLNFAVVPNLRADIQAIAQLYTPAHPFQVVLYGLTEDDIVRRADIAISRMSDGGLQVTWADMRTEPRLLLRFGKIEIPLKWSIPHFMAWLEPAPPGPFLTLDELRGATLHTVGRQLHIEEFSISTSITGLSSRTYTLKRGRATVAIGQDQLYDMVRLAKNPHVSIYVQVAGERWELCEVRQRPDLPKAKVLYDQHAAVIRFDTGLQEEWRGHCRFLAESLSNPFAHLVELGSSDRLAGQHVVPCSLADGHYRLRVELDGVLLPLDKQATLFVVGSQTDDLVEIGTLIQEIRSGQLISSSLAQDFVLWWAEIAEKHETELTPSTLYQLATIPAYALENFEPRHLQRLWPVLAALRDVQGQDRWIETHGLFPAWILLPNPLIFRTLHHGFEWPVYPILAARGGLEGRGYGLWPISGSKAQVYVQWQPVSADYVHVEAGLPDETPIDWIDVDLLDTYGLYYCAHCGQLVGEKGQTTLPERFVQAHRHGNEAADLREINVDEAYGGYRLVVECLDGRRGKSLLDILNEYEVRCPSAHVYLPEPPCPVKPLHSLRPCSNNSPD